MLLTSYVKLKYCEKTPSYLQEPITYIFIRLLAYMPKGYSAHQSDMKCKRVFDKSKMIGRVVRERESRSTYYYANAKPRLKCSLSGFFLNVMHRIYKFLMKSPFTLWPGRVYADMCLQWYDHLTITSKLRIIVNYICTIVGVLI